MCFGDVVSVLGGLLHDCGVVVCCLVATLLGRHASCSRPGHIMARASSALYIWLYRAIIGSLLAGERQSA